MPTTDVTDVARPTDLTSTRRLALPDRLTDGTGRATALQWLTTRAAMLTLLVAVEASMTGDVAYYARSLQLLVHGGRLADTLQEYPIPVLGIMLPQYLLGGLNQTAFTILFAASMLAVDAIFTRLLWRACGRRQAPAVTFWLWFVVALGPIAYFRFDVVPAALAGTALLCAVRRPVLSGVLTAIGAALKLWPAIMLPIFLIRRTHRAAIVASFLATGILLALISLAAGGYGRSVSPLHWQSGRGLQVESPAAAPVMLARMVHPHGPWTVSLSAHKAYEITGPGVSGLTTFSTVATLVGIAALAVLWLRAVRLPDASIEVVGWLLLATATVITVTNKVLSPQYVLWLGGPLAALAVFLPADRDVRRAVSLLVVIAVLTHLDYPLLYNFLVKGKGPVPLATVVLETRNVLLVLFAVRACGHVWQCTRRLTA
jgi:hypothetical protein